ncbi:MAG: hypothetical protein M3416_11255, partial [Acidobacteriota bacterium]|nr:hypothetical protein [Acidobacteriota bacterium]
MEVLMWPFVGLLVFVSWLVFLKFRNGERQARMRQRRDLERRHNRELWARVAGDAARLQARRARKPFAEPEITPGEINFGAGAAPRRRA